MNSEAFKNLTKAQQLYVESIREIGGKQLGYDLTKTDWTRRELVAVSMIRQSNDDIPNWIVKDLSRRVSRGVYSVPEVVHEIVVEDAEPDASMVCVPEDTEKYEWEKYIVDRKSPIDNESVEMEESNETI